MTQLPHTWGSLVCLWDSKQMYCWAINIHVDNQQSKRNRQNQENMISMHRPVLDASTERRSGLWGVHWAAIESVGRPLSSDRVRGASTEQRSSPWVVHWTAIESVGRPLNSDRVRGASTEQRSSPWRCCTLWNRISRAPREWCSWSIVTHLIGDILSVQEEPSSCEVHWLRQG